MEYFKYQYSGSMGKVWNLFTDLNEVSVEEKLGNSRKNISYSHTLEIVKSAMGGNALSKDDFCLKAYEYKCNENDGFARIKDCEKYLNIVDTSGDSDDSCRTGFGDIAETKLRSIEDAFDDFESMVDFEKSLNVLYSIQKDYIVEKGIDVVEMLLSSLKGIPTAVNDMASLVLEDPFLRDILESLCGRSEGMLEQRLLMSPL